MNKRLTIIEKEFLDTVDSLSKGELIKLIYDNNLLNYSRLQAFVICNWVKEQIAENLEKHNHNILETTTKTIKRNKYDRYGRYLDERKVLSKKKVRVGLINTLWLAAEKYNVTYEQVRKCWYYYYGEPTSNIKLKNVGKLLNRNTEI